MSGLLTQDRSAHQRTGTNSLKQVSVTRSEETEHSAGTTTGGEGEEDQCAGETAPVGGEKLPEYF